MGENSFGCQRKKSKKILEKCEMSFCSSENKNWTFRGSFDIFSRIYSFYMGTSEPSHVKKESVKHMLL